MTGVARERRLLGARLAHAHERFSKRRVFAARRALVELDLARDEERRAAADDERELREVLSDVG